MAFSTETQTIKQFIANVKGKTTKDGLISEMAKYGMTLDKTKTHDALIKQVKAAIVEDGDDEGTADERERADAEEWCIMQYSTV